MTVLDTTPSFRILVVDDNIAIHEDFRKILTKTKPQNDELENMEALLFGFKTQTTSPTTFFEIDCAFQGKEALKLVRQASEEGRPYALAFIDVRMPPGWDGIETVNYLWKESPDLQVVLCTAYSDYTWDGIYRVLGKNNNFLILKKPFDNVEVLQLAHALTCKWKQNREIQNRLKKLAFYDDLTGLPNRTLFFDRFARALKLAQRYHHKVALLFIDLDNFKQINDTLGHSAGDELLQILADRLVKSLRTSDTAAELSPNKFAARLGGDEFTIILQKLDNVEDAAVVAQCISKKFTEPIHLKNQEITITPSIGIATFPEDGENTESLIKNADLAMYFSKRTSPGFFSFYQESMTANALKRLTLENNLRQAIERNELTLYYQPQFDLITERISGMEALLRWQNYKLGNVPPLEFIPVAEESGLIITIGEWALRTACDQIVTWLKKGFPLQHVAVNFSVKELIHPNFLDMVKKILSETGLEPQFLEIEITESFFAEKNWTVILNKLKKMGIKIALDDFGTGYSSLSHLREMPIDSLKIDSSFVCRCGISNYIRDENIICAIITMAQSMNLNVIAEGIETREQADFLKKNHCKEAQGFFFSRPMPAHQINIFFQSYIEKTEENILRPTM